VNMEFIDIIDENDKVIGNAAKNEIYEKKLLHRIVHIFVFNENDELALQLQSKHKKFCPLHWVSSAAGHVRSGETSETAALRELEEEIGTKTDIEFMWKDLYEYKIPGEEGLKKMLISFKAKFNGPFKINPWEVEKVEFFSLDKINEMINNGEKFHPELLFLLKKHVDF
jgi:isopentenyl-diphosphate delta-isomerase type 1